MKRLLLLAATIFLLPQSAEAAFQNPRIVPQIAQPGEPVSLIIEVTNPDVLGIGGFPNIVSERVITRQIVGKQIQLLVEGGGTIPGLPDVGDAVIPIGSFLEPGSYTVDVLIVSRSPLGSGMDFADTLGFLVTAPVPTLHKGPLLFLILSVLFIGTMAWRKSCPTSI